MPQMPNPPGDQPSSLEPTTLMGGNAPMWKGGASQVYSTLLGSQNDYSDSLDDIFMKMRDELNALAQSMDDRDQALAVAAAPCVAGLIGIYVAIAGAPTIIVGVIGAIGALISFGVAAWEFHKATQVIDNQASASMTNLETWARGLSPNGWPKPAAAMGDGGNWPDMD